MRGNLQEARSVLDQVTDFCKSIGLTVNPDKTKITNLNKDRAFFLGVNIFRSRVTKTTPSGNKQNPSAKQRQNKQLRLTASLDRIRSKLKGAGFIKGGKSHPRFLWLPLNHTLIIHLYNSVFKGYLNYYSFVHNYGQMVGLLNLTLIRSAAKLLAAKYKLRTTAKVFKKFGKQLSSEGTSFLKPKYTTDPNRFHIKANPVTRTQCATHK